MPSKDKIDKEQEKREKKKIYLKNYYDKNKSLWREGEKYYKRHKKVEPLVITRGKVLVSFD